MSWGRRIAVLASVVAFSVASGNLSSNGAKLNKTALATIRGSCPEGYIEWYGGGCGYAEDTEIDHTAAEAEEFCAQRGLHLPSVHSVEESLWIRDTVKRMRWQCFVLGLVSQKCEWFDGTRFDFDYMASGQSCDENVKSIAICAKDDGHWAKYRGTIGGIVCAGLRPAPTTTPRPTTRPPTTTTPTTTATTPTTTSTPPTTTTTTPTRTTTLPTTTPQTTTIQPTTSTPTTTTSTVPPTTSIPQPTTYTPSRTTPSTTPTTTAWKASTTTSPSIPTDSCGECTLGSVWLDIVFAVDSSQSMQQDGIDDVQATIRTTLRHLKMERSEIRAGILVYSDVANVIYNLDSINSEANAKAVKIPYLAQYGTNMESAIVKSMSHFDDFPNTAKARKVIVLFASGYRDGDYNSPLPISVAFKAEGGIIVTVDYSGMSTGPVPILDDISSAGYVLNKTNFILDDLKQAFCDANCFCPARSKGYTTGSPWDCEGRCTPSGGCYRVVELAAAQDDAEDDCQEKGGNLVSVHDDGHQQFVTNLYAGRKQFWIGMSARTNTWSDGTPVDYSHWAPGQPDYNGDCVYSYQYSGLRTGWYTQKCQNALPYGCSIRPCSASNKDCKP